MAQGEELISFREAVISIDVYRVARHGRLGGNDKYPGVVCAMASVMGKTGNATALL